MIARPLIDLLRKKGFIWTEATIHAIDQLKTVLIPSPILKLRDITKDFIVETNASSMGIEVVLMLEGHPIAFASKALSPRRQSLSVYEKELLAIIFADRHWHYYLITGLFTIWTDQKSLKHLFEQKVTTPLQHTWLSKLMGYDYKIIYKKGSENFAADALSIVSGAEIFNMWVSSLQPLLLDRIILSYAADAAIQQLLPQLQ